MAALTEDVALTALVDGRRCMVQTHGTFQQRNQSLVKVLESHRHFNTKAAGITTRQKLVTNLKKVQECLDSI